MALPQSKQIVIAAVVILLLVIGFGLWQQLEWVEEEVDRGFSDEARQKPTLAAERFLRSLDLQAESRRGFSLLDEMSGGASPVTLDDNLVLINAHRTLREKRLQTLWQWVEDGGHLIVSARNRFLGNSNPEQDLLLARLGVELIDEAEYRLQVEQLQQQDAADPPAPTQQQPSQQPAAQDGDPQIYRDLPETIVQLKSGCSPAVVEVTFRDEDEPLKANWYGQPSLIDSQDRASGWISSEGGLKLLQFEIGEGMITVTTDNQIWTNRRIGCHDHAYMLWLFAGDSGKTWFVINQDSPSLWVTLWQAAPFGLALSLLALLLWLWQQAVRFGPILIRTHIERRRFLEHTQANAAFLWRHGQQHTLIKSLRDDINQRLRWRHRGFDELPEKQQVESLQRLTALPAVFIKEAMFAEAGAGEQDFQRLVEQLQQLRNRL